MWEKNFPPHCWPVPGRPERPDYRGGARSVRRSQAVISYERLHESEAVRFWLPSFVNRWDGGRGVSAEWLEELPDMDDLFDPFLVMEPSGLWCFTGIHSWEPHYLFTVTGDYRGPVPWQDEGESDWYGPLSPEG